MTPVAFFWGSSMGSPFLPTHHTHTRPPGSAEAQELPAGNSHSRISSGKDLLTCSSPLTQVITSTWFPWPGRQPRRKGRQAGRRDQREGRPSAAGSEWRAGARSERAQGGLASGLGHPEAACETPQPPDLGTGGVSGILD